MQATSNAKRSSEKLHEILNSMNYDISQAQCFDLISEINKNQSAEKIKKLNGGCLDVIARLEGYEGWSNYKGDVSKNLERVEQFVDEMMEGDKEGNYKNLPDATKKSIWLILLKKSFFEMFVKCEKILVNT